jgi:alkanesulfonate monooxygenase SsuD/methylene tetrahydromethanopterin reductase-like flavin-dependent oxidoreductase (luciferase family)
MTTPMTLVANFMSVDANPATWARDREAEGYDIVGVADHLWSSTRLFPHVWVSLGAMATATTTARLTTCFANNLFRSPVEFAQASFGMHALSGGRFEAGLGAGWTRAEMENTGRVFPEPRDRAGMYIEALSIVRSLFDTGSCHHDGAYYNVQVENLRPASLTSSPLLVGSVGGARTTREGAPLCDVVEIKGSSASTRGGDLDFGVIGTIPRSHLVEMVKRVRDVNADAPLGMFCFCSAIDDPRTAAVRASMPTDAYYRGFFSADASEVADTIADLQSIGITRATISPFTDASFPLLMEQLEKHR